METKLKQYEEELKSLQAKRNEFGKQGQEEINKLEEQIKKRVQEINLDLSKMLEKEIELRGSIKALKELELKN